MKLSAKHLLYGLIFVGCTTGEKIVNIREGLSKAEVIEMLGRLDGFREAVIMSNFDIPIVLLAAGLGIAQTAQ